MARKEFKYRGHSVEELKAMSMDDVVGLYPSRIRRSLKRGFNEKQKKFIARYRKVDKENQKKPLRTHCRDMPVLPEMVGLIVGIYTGKEFATVTIMPEMIGKYLGELALTRKTIRHSAPGVGATRSSLFVPVK